MVDQHKLTVIDCAVGALNAGKMCKGCFTKMIASKDMNYKCPIHD